MKNTLDHLRFTNWIAKNEVQDPNWIVVARSIKENNEDLFTTSILAKATTDDKINILLMDSEWITHNDFGIPTFYRRGNDKKIYFDIGSTQETDGIIFEPFTICREFYGIHPLQFDVVQSFILYHNLYFVEERSLYRKITEDGEEIDVMIITKTDDKNEIKIHTKMLRDYLAARGMILLRQHDHRRFSNESLAPEFTKNERKEYKHKDISNCNYSIYIKNESLDSNINSFSLLMGKDIIRPLANPDHSQCWFSDDAKAAKQYCKYVIKLDDNGNNVEETCNEKELSNNFCDTGKPHYLTSVFFKKDVLKRYYDNPSKYTVDSRQLKCLSLWGLPIDTNDKGLIYVYLGDLGHIPYNEQMHWKIHNVPPEGSITEHRWKTDFLAEFADSNEPIFLFKQAFERAQQHFIQTFGFQLFEVLKAEDAHCYSTLHIPVNDEQKEFDEEVQYLAKVINDSLNKGQLDKNEEHSITALEIYLSKKVGQQKANNLVKPFRNIQSLRSSGVAHTKGTEYQKVVAKAGLTKYPNQEKFKILLKEVTDSLNEISRMN